MKAKLRKQKPKYNLTPWCLHIIAVGTILVIGILSAYIHVCFEDGFLSQAELTGTFECFFICITELLLFNLAFDIIYKYENRGEPLN